MTSISKVGVFIAILSLFWQLDSTSSKKTSLNLREVGPQKDYEIHSKESDQDDDYAHSFESTPAYRFSGHQKTFKAKRDHKKSENERTKISDKAEAFNGKERDSPLTPKLRYYKPHAPVLKKQHEHLKKNIQNLPNSKAAPNGDKEMRAQNIGLLTESKSIDHSKSLENNEEGKGNKKYINNFSRAKTIKTKTIEKENEIKKITSKNLQNDEKNDKDLKAHESFEIETDRLKQLYGNDLTRQRNSVTTKHNKKMEVSEEYDELETQNQKSISIEVDSPSSSENFQTDSEAATNSEPSKNAPASHGRRLRLSAEEDFEPSSVSDEEEPTTKKNILTKTKSKTSTNNKSSSPSDRKQKVDTASKPGQLNEKAAVNNRKEDIKPENKGNNKVDSKNIDKIKERSGKSKKRLSSESTTKPSDSLTTIPSIKPKSNKHLKKNVDITKMENPSDKKNLPEFAETTKKPAKSKTVNTPKAFHRKRVLTTTQRQQLWEES